MLSSIVWCRKLRVSCNTWRAQNHLRLQVYYRVLLLGSKKKTADKESLPSNESWQLRTCTCSIFLFCPWPKSAIYLKIVQAVAGRYVLTLSVASFLSIIERRSFYPRLRSIWSPSIMAKSQGSSLKLPNQTFPKTRLGGKRSTSKKIAWHAARIRSTIAI